jgi:divalent metal cation (Fe/Co/Zn/Cd) transporter
MPRDWTQIGIRLVAATLAYNIIEAIVALWSGAEAESIALLGFGLDSVIECAAAGVLFWRLSVEARGADHDTVERTETRVHRFVGGTFIALAIYVTTQAGWTLWKREAPQESWPGILLATASLIIMPVIAFWKLRAAREIRSRALRAEARETLACAYLSFALLVGLVANAAAGLWWADPVAALAMVPWLVKEGREGLRGEGCCEDD